MSNFSDVWAIITGIAGIVSLLLALNEKYANWKKYTVPICAGLVGFAIGRFTIVISSSPANFTSEHMSIVVLTVALLIAAMIIFYLALKYGQPVYAYLLVCFIVFMGLPKVFSLSTNVSPAISPGDYIALSKYKEKMGDYDGAINYLEKYIDSIRDKEMVEQAKKALAELKKRQLTEP